MSAGSCWVLYRGRALQQHRGWCRHSHPRVVAFPKETPARLHGRRFGPEEQEPSCVAG